MTIKRGFSIRIFLPSGSADGLKVVEKSNWSGRGIICPRAIYTESKKRPDFNSTGVYILIGPSETGDVPTVYIGQGDPVRPRLDSHFANKGFWTQAVFSVSKDENLNKAHIQYIEAKLIQLAKDAKRCELDNGNAPVLPSLSEMDEADSAGFLDEVLLCLPIMGVNVFTKPSSRSHTRQYFLKGSGAEAAGYESTDGFVVLAGGKSRVSETDSIHKYVTDIRSSLVERGILVSEGGDYRLAQNYTFNSPSQAAAVMMGRNANGRVEWKDKNGRTLKEIQESQTEHSDRDE